MKDYLIINFDFEKIIEGVEFISSNPNQPTILKDGMNNVLAIVPQSAVIIKVSEIQEDK